MKNNTFFAPTIKKYQSLFIDMFFEKVDFSTNLISSEIIEMFKPHAFIFWCNALNEIFRESLINEDGFSDLEPNKVIKMFCSTPLSFSCFLSEIFLAKKKFIPDN